MATDPKILARVQALLAKADGTDYGPESEAFLAKATELMAKFGIDRADLQGAARDRGDITRHDLPMTGNYLLGRATVLGIIADVNGLDMIRTPSRRSNTGQVVHLFGRRDAIEATLALYTLIDAQLASFLTSLPRAQRGSAVYGFATAIQARLAKVRQAANDASGGDLLPALRDDKALAARALRVDFPRIVQSSPRASSAAGYNAGRGAGRNANLGQRGVGSRLALGSGR